LYWCYILLLLALSLTIVLQGQNTFASKTIPP
jgi:hypothetical protein